MHSQSTQNPKPRVHQSLKTSKSRQQVPQYISPNNNHLHPSERREPLSIKLQNFMPQNQPQIHTQDPPPYPSNPEEAYFITPTNPPQPSPSPKLLSLKSICEALKITKYLARLEENEVGIEDLFMLTERDLGAMGFSIGAKNRVIQFQSYFKRCLKKDPGMVRVCSNLVQEILEDNLGYSLKSFLKITQASQNELLKAMNELCRPNQVEKFDCQSTDTFMSSFKAQDHLQSYNDYIIKDSTPSRKRNTSVGSCTSYGEEKASQASSNIYTTNKFRNESDKENDIKISKYNHTTYASLLEKQKEFEQITNYEIKNGRKLKIQKEPRRKEKGTILSTKMRIVQQEDPGMYSQRKQRNLNVITKYEQVQPAKRKKNKPCKVSHPRW